MASIGGILISNKEKWNSRILTFKNPFSGSIVRSAWETVPDVESINAGLTRQVLNFLNEVYQSHITKIMLIQGQPGIGKSHFISRLRRIANKGEFLFVTVRPISDVTTIFNHIYRETFTSLRKKSPGSKYTPMDSLISNIVSRTLVSELRRIESHKSLPKKIKNFIDTLEKKPTLIFKLLENDSKSLEFLKSITGKTIQSIEVEYPEVDLTFLTVLFKALDPDLKPYSLRWLQGEDIPDEQLQALGVRTTINNDQIAQRVLHSVMTLSDRPILLCFDQLESIYDRFGDPGVLFAFFDTIIRLCNETPNALLLLMCQAGTWNEQIFPRISQAAKDRIELIESLKTPDSDEMYQLVKLRMSQLWEYFPYPPEPDIYPFTKEYIEKIAEREGWNPRNVIRILANDISSMKKDGKVIIKKEVPPAQPSKPPDQTSLEQYIVKQMGLHVSSFKDNIDENSYPDRENDLEAGLYDLFRGCMENNKNIGNYTITNVRFKKKEKELDMIVHMKGNKNERWGFEICNKQNSQSFAAVLRRIDNHLIKKDIDNWIILRDKDLRIPPTWKKTNEFVRRLEEKGGRIIYIDTESNVQIFACRKILDSASSGELEFNGQLISRKILLPIILDKFLYTIPIIKKIFNLPTEKDNSKQTTTGQRNIQERILQEVERSMLVNMEKIFPDFRQKEKEYRKFVDILKERGMIITISDKGGQLVISRAPGDDIF